MALILKWAKSWKFAQLQHPDPCRPTGQGDWKKTELCVTPRQGSRPQQRCCFPLQTLRGVSMHPASWRVNASFFPVKVVSLKVSITLPAQVFWLLLPPLSPSHSVKRSWRKHLWLQWIGSGFCTALCCPSQLGDVGISEISWAAAGCYTFRSSSTDSSTPFPLQQNSHKTKGLKKPQL